MRKELSNVEVDILGVADVSLFITQVLDVKTGSVNDVLTPNRNLKISGGKLKIADDAEPSVSACGVFFVNQETQERTKVDASDIVVNYPSELIVVIPELAAGTYKIEVVTRYGSSNGVLLKEPRNAVLDIVLSVA